MVNMGKLATPNLQLRKSESIHRYGYNVMAYLDRAELKRIADSGFYQSLAKKYKVSNQALLLKSLIQLGYITCINIGDLDLEYISTHFERLIHPFVHRRVYVSAIRIISLEIEVADVEAITDASESIESQNDRMWMVRTERAPDRNLTSAPVHKN